MKESYPQRVIFPKGKQRDFLHKVEQRLTSTQVSDLVGVCGRTICDWRREKYSISLPALQKLCIAAKLRQPKEIKIESPFWYTSKGARMGWKVLLKKYGGVPVDPEYRKKKWFEWWEREGRFKDYPFLVARPIHRPRYSKNLAEFTGIMMGDGGVTPRQLIVTLHSINDREYADFVQNLIESLFNVPVVLSFIKTAQALSLIVSRTQMVNFCHQKIGLKIGNKLKQGLDIPVWIKQSPNFLKACIRGLIDTDGGVFFEVHHINNRTYSYPRLNFVSASPALIQSVFLGLEQLGMAPRIRRHGQAIQLESLEQIRQYCHVIGTHNPKHQRKLQKAGAL